MRRLVLLAAAVLMLVGLLVALPFGGADDEAHTRPPESAAIAEPPAEPDPAQRPERQEVQPERPDIAPIAEPAPARSANGPAEREAAPPQRTDMAATVANPTAPTPRTAAQTSLASAHSGSDVAEPTRGTGPSVNLSPAGRCSVSLNQALLARDVNRRDRAPLGVADAFPASGQPVFLFLDVDNAGGPDRDLRIRWEHDASGHVFEQNMPAGTSPRWRTWVYHNIQPGLAGPWRVKIYDPRGCQAGELSFEAR